MNHPGQGYKSLVLCPTNKLKITATPAPHQVRKNYGGNQEKAIVSVDSGFRRVPRYAGLGRDDRVQLSPLRGDDGRTGLKNSRKSFARYIRDKILWDYLERNKLWESCSSRDNR